MYYPLKDESEARADSAFYALMFLVAGVVMGGAVFLQVGTGPEKYLNPRLYTYLQSCSSIVFHLLKSSLSTIQLLIQDPYLRLSVISS